jgi:ribulose-phosphate 3-epimerase
MKIAVSILSADFTRLGDQIALCEAGGADWIHIDVMDGQFVPNITLGPVIVAAARRTTRLPLDVHLMIAGPERYLAAFAEAGADRMTVHQEACPHLYQTVQQIKGLGKRAGVAVNPGTPAALLSEVLPELDTVLAMTVEPGFSGQQFMPHTLRKVAQLREMARASGAGYEIQVDGGIDPTTAPLAAQAGATVIVAATAVFRADVGVSEAVQRLRGSVSLTTAGQTSGRQG